jgi:NADPH:quinone reductase-like Zn-dependent oxidoreductase
MAIQIAKLFKARVITTSTSEEKLSLAHDLGADICINTKRDDFLKVVRKDHPLGVDIIVDHVGEVFWEKNIRLLTGGGALVTCGATSGYDAKTDLRHVFFRQLRILGSTMGNKRDFLQIIELMKKRKLRAVIDEEFALSQLADAHRRLQAGKQNGKVLLKIS